MPPGLRGIRAFQPNTLMNVARTGNSEMQRRPTLIPSRFLPACERADYMIENVTVAIWSVELRKCSAYTACLTTLSADELSRAKRFLILQDRTRYVISHGVLRMILSDYTNIDPKRLKFQIDRHGKPSLDLAKSSPDIRFNLSHSGNMAMIAVALGHEVGVDIERVKNSMARLSEAEQFLSNSEVSTLRSLPKVDQELAFFTCWTRKEAYLKGRGDGLSVPLCDFDVSLVPGETAALLGSRIDPKDVDCWRLFEVSVGDGYVASAAVKFPSS